MNPPKVRVEIFKEPAFFDDHFVKDWAVISGADGSDGDIVEITGIGAAGRIERNVGNINTQTYSKLVVRVTTVIGDNTTWGVKVWNGVNWVNVFTGQTETGVFETTIPTSTVKKIALLEEYSGDATNRVKFDYCAICKGLSVPDLGDLTDELRISRPILNNGISGAKFSIPNFNGEYNGKIKPHDVVIVWLARSDSDLGKTDYKIFGGRVVKLVNRSESYGKFFIDVECHGHEYELNVPSALLQKVYSGINGRTIIEECLNLCDYLVKHPAASKWFDNAGSSGSTDDRIDSTHDVIYNEEKLLTVIKEILEKAKNPGGVRGFDAYATPAGCIIGHLRNSLDFNSAITSVTPRSYLRSRDIHKVRNKIKVYGKFDPTAKLPKDENWTESLDEWTAIVGTLQLAGSVKVVGNYSVRCDAQWDSDRYRAKFKRTFKPEHTFVSGNPNSIPNSATAIYFQFRAGACSYGGEPVVYLLAPDASNYFYRNVNWTVDTWEENEFEIGENSSGWNSVGSPEWGNLTAIQFELWRTDAGVTAYVDDLHFVGNRFYAEVEDADSQNKYGVRVNKPIIDDSLNSDEECNARAKSLLEISKDKVIILSNVITDGDHRFTPGDRQRIIVSNDNLDNYFRILNVEHVVRESMWDTILTLSNEPQYIDYVFRLLKETTKLLERRA